MQPIDALRTALEIELERVPLSQVRSAVHALSKRYHQQTDFGALSTEEVVAYGAFRMTATFHAIDAAFEQIKHRLGTEFRPRHLLDAGAGPGTSMWSALGHWPSLTQITLVEKEPAMIRLGKRLQSHSVHAPIQNAKWMALDLTRPLPDIDADLVVLSYVAGELRHEQRHPLIHRLWSRSPRVLLVVEPGTPWGFAIIREIRHGLIRQGARIVAPCPHDQACPMTEGDWCHFARRLSRSRLHRQAKSATLGYEDEKFSYVAVAPTLNASPVAIEGRILRRPLPGKGHVALSVCTTDGVVRKVLTRKDGPRYKTARHLRWGDPLP